MSQHAEKCPVCEGKSQMPGSFYDDHANDEPVDCRSCGGKGYVIVGHEGTPYPVYPSPNPWQPVAIWSVDSIRPDPLLGWRWT